MSLPVLPLNIMAIFHYIAQLASRELCSPEDVEAAYSGSVAETLARA